MLDSTRPVAAAPVIKGRILFNYRHVIECLIRASSDEGACLQLDHGACVPATFDLIARRPGGSHACRVIGRSGDLVFVAFC